jgi:hypothetical protein
MMESEIVHDFVTVRCSYEEIYILLQCVAETRDHRSEGDVGAIIGVTRARLGTVADELSRIKQRMVDLGRSRETDPPIK